MMYFLLGMAVAIVFIMFGLGVWFFAGLFFSVAAIEEKHDEERDLTNDPK